MNEKSYLLEQYSELTSNSKNSFELDFPEKVKRSFASNINTNNNNIINTNNNSSNNISNNKKNETSSSDKGMNTIMINLIKKLKKLKKEGKNEEDFYSILPKMLQEINSNIIDITDENNNTLAHLAINEDIVELLAIICNIYYLLVLNKNEFYDWFMKENYENLTILDMASIKENKEMLEFLYEIISRTEGSKLKFNEKKNNIFHSCAKFNKYYSILFWYDNLQAYFPYLKIIDLSNEYGITPLHYACFHGSANCVELLLDLQADINAIDKDGKSILIYAVFSGDIKIIKKLLMRGANKYLKDSEGRTAYDYAIKNNKFGIATLLKNYTYIEKFNNLMRCNNDIEIKHLKQYRYDYEILAYLQLYLILIVIFTLKFFLESNYKKLSHVFQEMAFISIGLNYLFLFFSLILIIYFKCIIRFRQHLKKNKSNFLSMYDKTNANNICVKCIRIKKENTIHCAVCNLCIDDWDHHCFWLNSCITKNNMKIFTFFLISIFSFLITNIIFSIVFLIIYFFENNKERDEFIRALFDNDIGINLKLRKSLYLAIFFVVLILFSFLFIYHFSSIMISPIKTKKIIEMNENRESINDVDNGQYHENLIDSFIDKSDD